MLAVRCAPTACHAIPLCFASVCLQPYRKRGKRSVQTVLQTFTITCARVARARVRGPHKRS